MALLYAMVEILKKILKKLKTRKALPIVLSLLHPQFFFILFYFFTGLINPPSPLFPLQILL